VAHGFVSYPSKERAAGSVLFSDFVKAEVVKWTALTKEANIQPE
jgi:hypothetical protein